VGALAVRQKQEGEMMNNEEMRDKRIIDRQRDEAPEIELVTRGHAASLNCNPDYECGPDSCARQIRIARQARVVIPIANSLKAIFHLLKDTEASGFVRWSLGSR